MISPDLTRQRPDTAGDTSLSAPRTTGHIISTQLVINNLIFTHLLKLSRCTEQFQCDYDRLCQGRCCINNEFVSKSLEEETWKTRELIGPILQRVTWWEELNSNRVARLKFNLNIGGHINLPFQQYLLAVSNIEVLCQMRHLSVLLRKSGTWELRKGSII